MKKRLKRVFVGMLSTVALFGLINVHDAQCKAEKTIYAATMDKQVQSGDWRYEILEDGTIEIVGYTGEETQLVVPSQIDNYTVTRLGFCAFSGCEYMTSIEIPETVNSLGSSIFDLCYSLKTIKIDEDNGTYDSRDNCNAIIETASNKLVFGCSGTVIPDSVTTIGKYAFMECYGLENITIPETVTCIERGAFYDCTNLKSANIPKKVTNIYEWTFFNCSKLGNVEIPKGVTSIGERAFDGCDTFTSVVIPDGVTKIDTFAFSNCVNLENITIPDSVESIGENAFYRSSKLVILSSENSFAHRYAVDNKIAWKDVSPTPSKVTGFTYSARSAKAILLKWNRDLKAHGYTIEQYKNGKWVIITDVTDNKTVSYKATGLTDSTANMFRIRAYKKYDSTKYYGAYTTKTFNTLPAGVKNFTYSARSSSAVLLKWAKNPKANGYVIEQYKGGKWIKIKTITKNSTVSYKVKELPASTANKFRIKAYKSYGKTNLYSGYVTKTVNTLPSAVTGFTYSARSTKAILLKWNKNNSATGYVIEQYKNGKWVKIKTVTNKSSVSYKVTGLKKATSYKFRIRAYKSYGSAKLYSSYVTKTMKTK